MKTAVIAGAGPAGLTAALELLKSGGWKAIVCEAGDGIGGIAKTVNHGGNRMDLGGHRFFTKSTRVQKLWAEVCPQMKVRPRKSRIFFGGKFFDYPVSLTWATLRALGLRRSLETGLSFIGARLRPRTEQSLEDFYINRFGRKLYEMFFRDYTAKVWGVSPSQLRADWGAQRVKGLSITKVIAEALRNMLGFRGKEKETSLIDRFEYPPLGPGQMWDRMADRIRDLGGEIRLNSPVSAVGMEGERIVNVTAGGEVIACDAFFSSMPLAQIVDCFPAGAVAEEIAARARELPYRDFIMVGVLVDEPCRLTDNWIYLQDANLRAGRLQVFNNWAPTLVARADTTWLGLEFFCNEGDDLWTSPDADLASLAVSELAALGFANPEKVIDTRVIRVEKAYPGYFGSYDAMPAIQEALDRIPNLYCIGRNGQHRYNNMDHSMLTAITAVELLLSGASDKSALWRVNAEQEYHESK